MFDYTISGKIFTPKINVVTKKFITLHNKQLCDLYVTSTIYYGGEIKEAIGWARHKCILIVVEKGLGVPGRKWEDGVIMGHGETRCEDSMLMELAKDHILWQVLAVVASKLWILLADT